MMPSSRRHPSMRRGSGPVSTTTPVPSPAASTMASPWPTSHRANAQSGGGHPVMILVSGTGLSTASTSRSAAAEQTQGVSGETAHGQHEHSREDGQQGRALPATGPVGLRSGEGSSGACHGRDPPDRPAGDQGQGFGRRHRHRSHGECRESQHRGRRHREFGQQIAGDRHQADPRGEDHDDRRADRLRGTRRGQHLGEPRRHPVPLQCAGPPWRESQQRPGGQHGQQKAVTAGQPRVVQHQQQDGSGECRDQRSAPARADGEKRDQAAGSRSQNTWFRAADDHEGERDPAADQCGHAQGDAQPWCQAPAFAAQGRSRWPDEEEEQDRQVGT